MLEKNSTTPLYIQLKNIIKNAVINGEIGEGQMIPSETQLAETYNITRTTVRRALAELVNENLIRKEHGKGAFASLKPMSYSMWNFNGFSSYVHKKGKIPTSKILSTEVILIEDKQYYKLERARGVREGTEIHFLTVDTSNLPLDLFPGIETFDFEKRSLYDVMRKEYGIYPSIVEISIKPQIIDQKIAELFVVSEGIPLLMVQGHVLSEDNLLVELTQVIYSPNVDFKLGTRINTT